MFLFMSVYSLSEYFTVLLLYGKATSLDNAEYLFIDIFCVLPVAIGLANSLPAKSFSASHQRCGSRRRAHRINARSGDSRIHRSNGHLPRLHTKYWYPNPFFDAENLTLNDMDNTALFRTSVFTYIIAGFAFSLGPPHRQLLCFNWILAPALVILTIFAFYFLFLTGGPFFTLFGFVDMPKHFSWIIFGVVVAQFAAAMAFEFAGVPIVARYAAMPFNAARRRLGGGRARGRTRLFARAIYA